MDHLRCASRSSLESPRAMGASCVGILADFTMLTVTSLLAATGILWVLTKHWPLIANRHCLRLSCLWSPIKNRALAKLCGVHLRVKLNLLKGRRLPWTSGSELRAVMVFDCAASSITQRSFPTKHFGIQTGPGYKPDDLSGSMSPLVQLFLILFGIALSVCSFYLWLDAI